MPFQAVTITNFMNKINKNINKTILFIPFLHVNKSKLWKASWVYFLLKKALDLPP